MLMLGNLRDRVEYDGLIELYIGTGGDESDESFL